MIIPMITMVATRMPIATQIDGNTSGSISSRPERSMMPPVLTDRAISISRAPMWPVVSLVAMRREPSSFSETPASG